MKATRRAGDPPQFSYSEQGYTTAPPDILEVSSLSLSALSSENAGDQPASNLGMYGQNISKGADRQNSNRTGGNSNTRGAAQNHHASRVYDSPSSHSDQEYVYHGAPRAPSQLLGPGVSMALNNASFVQPGQANVFANQSPFMMEPMYTTMQPGYQVPGANFQAPLHRLSGAVMEKVQVQVQASPVVQELYSMPSTPDLQYELWANLEPEIFAQEPVPQYNVAPGDIGMVESFDYEQPRPSMPFTTTWNPAPAICQQHPGPNTNIAADYKTWAILSQALPDVGVDDSSSSGQASIASTSTGDATTRKDRQEYSAWKAQHGVAQNSNQGYTSRQAQREVAQNSNQRYPLRQTQHEVAQNSNQGYTSRQAQHEVAQNFNQGYAPRQAPHEVAQNSNHGYPSRQAQHEVAQNSNQGYPSRQAQHEVAQNSNHGYPSRQAQHEVAQNCNQGYASRQAQHDVAQNSNHGYPSRQAQHEVAQNSNQGYPSRQAQHEIAQNSNHGYPSRQAQHEVAQNCNQGYPSRQAQHEVAQNSNQGLYSLAVNEYGGTNMMDMVMEDSISDGISSTEDPSQREVAPAQIPHGYNIQNFSSDSSVVTDSGWQRSSRPEKNVWDPQPLLELQESYNASTAGAAAFNGGAVANDFTQLMGQGLSGIRQLGEARWAIQLLSLCAEAIASQNVTRTQHLMWVLNDLASLGGDVNQRFAAYGLRALYMRVTNHAEAIKTYLRPRHHDQEITCGPKTVHNALVKFHEYVPWHQNCYSASSQTLLEVCAGKSRLHLIDIGAGKGIEWPIFIDALVSRAGGPPSILRITMIKERRKDEQVQAKSVSSEAADFMTRLVKFASGLGLHVEVNVVGKALECVTREDLRLRQGEILAVVCQFRLHRLMEEVPERPSNSPPSSKSLLSPRDEFLDFLFQLNPHVLIMSDNDSDQCSPEFLPRFQNVANFWWSFFESMDMGYAGRDSPGRQIIEYEAGLMVLNVAACEGRARLERNEPYERWSRRIRRAGFVPKMLSDEAKKVCQDLVLNHSSFWDLAFDDNNCVLRWRKEPMTFTSVWATPDHCSKHSCKCSMLHN